MTYFLQPETFFIRLLMLNNHPPLQARKFCSTELNLVLELSNVAEKSKYNIIMAGCSKNFIAFAN